MSEIDYSRYMLEAIECARNGSFSTYPNPAVGAVLIKDGQIVARGFHKKAGENHAEINCLEDAKAKNIPTENTTMVVTLEPCTHTGKTPPCTDAIIKAKITNLVYGTNDINFNAKGGADLLRKNGLNVIGPVCEQQCKDLIKDYLIWQQEKRPYVILKLASSLDGKIALANGESRWISCETSRNAVQKLRAKIGKVHGAILIGGQTFRRDNPHLTVKNTNTDQPLACIITSQLPNENSNFNLLKERPKQTIFFTTPATAASIKAHKLRESGVRVIPLEADNSSANLEQMLNYLFVECSCPYILCEGGGELALSILNKNLVDEFHLYLSPMIIGDKNAKPLFSGLSPSSLSETLNLKFQSININDVDAHIILTRPK